MDDAIVSDHKLNAGAKIHRTIERFFGQLQSKQKLIRMMAQMGLQTGKFDFINKMISKKYESEITKIRTSLEEMQLNRCEVEAYLFMATLDGILFQVLIMGEIIPTAKMKKALLGKYSAPKE